MAKVIMKKGDAVYPDLGDSFVFIPHVVNDEGAFGKGFAQALANRWPETKRRYFDWRKSRTFKLGAIEIQPVDAQIAVVHMLCQQGLPGPNNPQPLNYEFLKQCLQKLNHVALESCGEIHAPKIGCGLARGEWHCVRDLIEACLSVPVTIYVP